MITFLTILSAVLAIVTCTLSILLIKKNKQILKVNETLTNVSEGNLSRRIRLQTTDRQFEQLANQINEQLEAWSQTIEKANRLELLRKQMITNISHDLRTPLTSILGYTEALQNEGSLSAEERTQYLSVIANKGNHLLKIINDFFDLVRIEAEEELQEEEPVHMNEIVKEEILWLYHSFSEIDVKPQIHISNEAIYVKGEAQGLRRIISNLLSNAIRYGKDGEVIGIELTTEENIVLLKVWDEGKGIQKSDMNHIFERLYTGESSRNSNLQGSGLGLTIVKKLVEKHHGRIEVESEPYIRTAFTCFFPLHKKVEKS